MAESGDFQLKGVAKRFGAQFCTALFILVTTLVPVRADDLLVGASEIYKKPSDAARAAKPGDTVTIDPGTYRDCAVWLANDLTIEGSGADTVLTDTVCEGKAIFVIRADAVTVRNITFQHARADDGNGAGIRSEGTNLIVEHARFLNNQEGILTSDGPKSALFVRNSVFLHNGTCLKKCAHGIYAGHIALLGVERSWFFDTQEGHHIKSRAARTILVGNHIMDGASGTASYEVDIPNGGSVLMTGNVLEKGPKNGDHKAAVIIGEEGVTQPTPELTFRNNSFSNKGPSPFYFLFPTAFVKNETSTPAILIGNSLLGSYVTPLSGPGSVR